MVGRLNELFGYADGLVRPQSGAQPPRPSSAPRSSVRFVRRSLERLAEPFVYYGTVVWDAVRATWRHIRAHIMAGVITYVLGSLLGCRWQEGACQVTEVKAGLVAVAIYLGSVLLFNIAMAPVRIHREGAMALDALRDVQVRLTSKDLREAATDDHAAGGPDWAYLAYQVKDGIELVWRALYRESTGQNQIPRDAQCVLRLPGNRNVTARVIPQLHEIRCVYPGDFPEVTPTTGHLDFIWQATDRVFPPPSLEYMRREPGARPPEPRYELRRFAWWSLDVEVTRGGQLA
jgi:hypothetical protein